MTVKCFVFDRSNVFYVIKEILNVFSVRFEAEKREKSWKRRQSTRVCVASVIREIKAS